MDLIHNLYQPEYIIYQRSGKYAGNYAAIVSVGDKEAFASVQLGEYKDSMYAPDNFSGFYNTLITAFYPNSGYLDENIFTEFNDIVYDKSVDKKYEIPQQVASGETPSDRASGISDKILSQPTLDFNTESNKTGRKSDRPNRTSEETVPTSSAEYTRMLEYPAKIGVSFNKVSYFFCDSLLLFFSKS